MSMTFFIHCQKDKKADLKRNVVKVSSRFYPQVFVVQTVNFLSFVALISLLLDEKRNVNFLQ